LEVELAGARCYLIAGASDAAGGEIWFREWQRAEAAGREGVRDRGGWAGWDWEMRERDRGLGVGF
jgi:hypothetical protein